MKWIFKKQASELDEINKQIEELNKRKQQLENGNSKNNNFKSYYYVAQNDNDTPIGDNDYPFERYPKYDDLPKFKTEQEAQVLVQKAAKNLKQYEEDEGNEWPDNYDFTNEFDIIYVDTKEKDDKLKEELTY